MQFVTFAKFGVNRYEPRHDKTNNMAVHPAKTQISLTVLAVRMKKP